MQPPNAHTLNSNEISDTTADEVTAQPLETVFCQPDLSQLLSTTQGYRLEGLSSVRVPIEATNNAIISSHEVAEQQNAVVTDGYVVSIQQVCG